MDRYSPRAWQPEFKEAVLKAFQEGQRNFFLSMPVASGKTMGARDAVLALFPYLHDPLIVVVSPSLQIVGGWRKAFKGLRLRIAEGAVPGLAPDVGVYLCTYQSLRQTRELLAALGGRRSIITIFDEIHHCREEIDAETDVSWGPEAIKTFGDAAFRLFLTATPWRTKGFLPREWIEYDEKGFVLPDFKRNRQEMIAAQCIREVSFLMIDSSGELLTIRGSRQTVEMLSMGKGDQKEDDRAIGSAIRGDDYIRRNILAGERELEAKVRLWQRLGGPIESEPTVLVVGDDAEHLKRIEKVVRAVTREDTTMVLSQIDGSHEAIDNFRQRKGKEGRTRWLLSCQMISEGCDIPHLSVIVVLTRRRTQLVIDQMLGRVVRNMGFEKRQYRASAIVPAHYAFIKYSEEMMDLQVELQEYKPGPTGPTGATGPEVTRIWKEKESGIGGATISNYVGHLNDVERMAVENLARDKELSEIDTAHLVHIVRKLSLRVQHDDNGHDSNDDPTDEAERLGSSCNKLVKKIAWSRSQDQKDIWKEAKVRTSLQPWIKLKVLTVEQLQDLHETLLTMWSE